MGRKAIHTQEEVFKVADELAAQGKEVTPNVLYEALGSRSSMTTIYKNLDAWTEQRKQVAAPMPVAMPDAVLASFNQTWQVAAQEAAKEVAAIREKADAEVQEFKRRLDDAKTTVARLEAESESDSVKIEMLDREVSDTKRAAGAAATEAAKREAALAATVEQMKIQIAEQQAALLRGHEEHQAFRQDKAEEVTRLTADFMARLAEQADAVRLANIEVSSLRGKLDDTTGQLAAARDDFGKQLADARKESDAAKADVERSKLAAQQAEQTLADTRRQLDEANAKALSVSGQLGNLTGQCDALRAQVQSQENLIKGFAGTGLVDGVAKNKTNAKPPAAGSGKDKK